MMVTGVDHFGSGSAPFSGNKEAAHSDMTFTLFKFLRRFPKCRSQRLNGIMHRLS
jgi:hypothetical protein